MKEAFCYFVRGDDHSVSHGKVEQGSPCDSDTIFHSDAKTRVHPCWRDAIAGLTVEDAEAGRRGRESATRHLRLMT